jgi:hypothetical protein
MAILTVNIIEECMPSRKEHVNTSWASVRLGSYRIPLLGVPESATLQECDLCHDLFHLLDVELIDIQILCLKCRGKSGNNIS